ncbi:helix-turn-helix domain-containing protein [Defluviimonas sp. SAOS-178_SWC]|uniref:helix-turn-helix domain-containing protein n=1 Tax=Defluviimonas sp. SAOS-178_SWC TaxID=3121287 RepID=UPI0032219489
MQANSMIGARVRQIRKDLNLSLDDLSKRSSVSIGTLSQIERGLGRPSLRTIERIGNALGVPIYWLFEVQANKDDAGADDIVVRSGKGAPLTVLVEGMKKTLITPTTFAQMQLMLVDMEPGSKSSAGFYQHEGIDVGYVLCGSLHLEVDDRLYVLATGDCFAFDSQLPHRFQNRGGTKAEVLWINTKKELQGLKPPS